MKISYLSKLQCSNCGDYFDSNQVHTFCLECYTPLLARYDLEAVKHSVDRDKFYFRPKGMWRWHELLPIIDTDNMISLGEGDTPLLRSNHLSNSLGLKNLFIKDESLNPTGSFKARGLASAVSKALELGKASLVIPTAGNAGGALAAYAARAGMDAHIYMPRDTPAANVEESRITGADINLVDGLISDAAIMANEKVKTQGWFDLSTFKEPYRVEGKKIMGYELSEAFTWDLPEVIIYPTGGGTGLVGMWKAFNELATLGWLETEYFPRMVAVQAEGCAPVVKAILEGKESCDFWPNAETSASGLRVPKSFADRLIIQNIRESNGTAVSVSEEEIQNAQRLLAKLEGIFTAPEGAATLAGLLKLIAAGWVKNNDRIVLFNTGTGLKYLN
jgi:threonine synthase